MLQLLVDRGAPPEQTDGAVRALVAQRASAVGRRLDDTASAMVALNAYAATEHLAPSNVTVSAGGTTIGTAAFGSDAGSRTFTQPAENLGAAPLTISSTGGTAHYVVLYTYPVAAGRAGRARGACA